MNNRVSKTASLILGLSLFHGLALGQTAATPEPIGYGQWFSYGLLALAVVVIVAAIVALFQLLSVMIKIQQIRIYEEAGLQAALEEARKPRVNIWEKLYERMTRTVPVEKEEDILMDHNYDGIRELDNRLPPWWVAMFYVTIVFAVVYMTYFHFAGIGMSSSEAYATEMAQAEEEVNAFLARQVNSVDESSVVAMTDERDLQVGATIFQVSCATCHGQLGEGGIGPNLTDQYWIHGGDVKAIFRTIKYGVPEKGMISWKAQLRPVEMQQVASYILTLQGTNPPNAKEPQGELFTPPEPAEEEAAEEDAAIGMATE